MTQEQIKEDIKSLGVYIASLLFMLLICGMMARPG